MPLPTRRIGPFTVSAIGLGCMNLSHAYAAPPPEADGIASTARSIAASPCWTPPPSTAPAPTSGWWARR